MIRLDGSMLTGGGQIIRTALALSAHTNKPFTITNIRAGRPRPGLMAQHLTAVKTLQELCNAEVQGAHLGSETIVFIPRGFTPKNMDVHIGTAGSVTLLTQALMLPSMHHKKVTYTLHGGVDVKWSPTYDYLRYVIVPALQRFGNVEVDLVRRGFYPKGQGSITLTCGMKKDVKPPTLLDRGVLEGLDIYNVASRDLIDEHTLESLDRDQRLFFEPVGTPITIRNSYAHTQSPGYVSIAIAKHNLSGQRIHLAADAVAEPDTPTHIIAKELAETLNKQLESKGVVDEHLADHLIPFMGLHGGELITTRISNHIKANIAVTEAFTNARFTIHDNHITVSRTN